MTVAAIIVWLVCLFFAGWLFGSRLKTSANIAYQRGFDDASNLCAYPLDNTTDQRPHAIRLSPNR